MVIILLHKERHVSISFSTHQDLNLDFLLFVGGSDGDIVYQGHL